MKIHNNYSPEGLKYKRSEDATLSWGSGDAFSVTGTVTTTKEKTVIKK